VGLLAPQKTKNMETKNLINVIEINNVHTQARVFDRVKRYALAAFEGSQVNILKEMGAIEILYGAIVVTRLAFFYVKSSPDGNIIYLLPAEGEGAAPILVCDQYNEGADIMDACPIWKAAEVDAKANQGKHYTEFKLGDYIYGWNGGYSKAANIVDSFYDIIWVESDLEYSDYIPTLLRVDKILDMTDEELNDLNFYKYNAEGFGGGSFSADVPEECPFSLNYAQQHSFINSVCLIRTPSRWLAIDPQGYNYAKYVYYPLSWRSMYADSVAQAQRLLDEKKQREREEQEARDNVLRRQYNERTAAALALMTAAKAKPLVSGKPVTERNITTNVRRYLKACFPDIVFKISSSSWEHFRRSIQWTGGPSECEVKNRLAVMLGDRWLMPSPSPYEMAEYEFKHNEFTRKYGRLTGFSLSRF
jgi:hypothetical protein